MNITDTRAPNWGVRTPPPPLNFGEGGSTPPDFEKNIFLIAHIGPFLIAIEIVDLIKSRPFSA